MTEELKRCPFCGGEGEVWEISGCYYVHCSGCSCDCKAKSTEEDAIAVWNRRVNPLQKWEAGSKPSDGWYFFVNQEDTRVFYLYGNTALSNSKSKGAVERYVPWYSWLVDYQAYGPIPLPEPEAEVKA